MKNKENHDRELGLQDLKVFVESEVFRVIQYLKKKGLYLLAILVIGFGSGYYFDKKQASQPNFTSSKEALHTGDVKKQKTVRFNYNSMRLIQDWAELYLSDEKWVNAGLKGINIEKLENGGPLVQDSKEEEASTDILPVESLNTVAGYGHFEVVAPANFDFQLLWDDVSQRIENIPHFSQLKAMDQLYLKNRKEELIKDLDKLNKASERESIGASDLVAVIQSKKALESELSAVEKAQLETSSILYVAYEVHGVAGAEDGRNYHANKTYHKKIQFPLVGLVLFLLGQWVFTINRNYTKKD